MIGWPGWVGLEISQSNKIELDWKKLIIPYDRLSHIGFCFLHMWWVGLGISQSKKIKLVWKKSPNLIHAHPTNKEIYKKNSSIIWPFDLLIFHFSHNCSFFDTVTGTSGYIYLFIFFFFFEVVGKDKLGYHISKLMSVLIIFLLAPN